MTNDNHLKNMMETQSWFKAVYQPVVGDLANIELQMQKNTIIVLYHLVGIL